jgi:branched-chain amino acid transport system substrate-binding protein
MTNKYESIILIVALVFIGAWVAGCGAAATPAPATEAPAAQATEEPSTSQEPTEAAAEPTEEAAEPTEAAAAAEPTEAAVAETEAEAPSGGEVLCGLGNGQEATGEPINVGAVVGATGPDDFSSAAKGAAAYFNCVNANGGINGRPINYIVEDDGWNPEQAAQVAAKLVNDDQVVAMVGSTSFVECGANAQLYEDENVIVIAGVGVPRECFYSANIAPTNQGPRLSNLGMIQYAYETYGAKKITCMAPKVPGMAEWICDGLAAWGKDKGVTVEPVFFDPATMDPTSLILQAISTEPDAITISTPAGVAIPLFKAAEEQDLRDKYHWMGPTSLYDLDFPAAVGSYWDGYLDAQIEFVNTDSTGPDNQAWLKILDEYGTPDDPRDSFSQAGFLAAKIFVATVLELDPASLDRDTVSEALRGVSNFESDLVCGPWYFGAEADLHNANHAGRVVQQVDGGWKTITDCFEVEDPDLAPILEMEAAGGLVD